MNGEQFLNSIRGLDCEINALDHERTKVEYRRLELLEQAENLGAGMDAVHVQHCAGSKTESLGVQLADLISPQDVVKRLNRYQERINQRIDELVARKEKAQGIIDRIPDARLRALLSYRYMSNLRWSTISDLMGYSQNWLEGKLKLQAIEAFELSGKTVQ